MAPRPTPLPPEPDADLATEPDAVDETELEYDTEPQWSEDRAHWWDGQQWLPAAEAKAKANAIAAVSPDSRPAYLPPADRPPLLTSSFVRRQLIIGGVVIAVVLSVLAVTTMTRKGPTTQEQVTKALTTAAAAEQAYLARTKHFTGSFEVLTKSGYEPQSGVTLTVIRADRRSYCLMASKQDVALYVTADAESRPSAISPEPCT